MVNTKICRRPSSFNKRVQGIPFINRTGAHTQYLQGKKKIQRRANLEETLAAAVKLHAEADAAGLTGAGELCEQSSQDGAGQGLLQQRGVCDHQVQFAVSKFPFF